MDADYSWIWVAAYFLFCMVNTNSALFAAQYFPVKDDSEARKAALLAAGLYVVGIAVWFTPPLVGRACLADLSSAYPGLQKPAEAVVVGES